VILVKGDGLRGKITAEYLEKEHIKPYILRGDAKMKRAKYLSFILLITMTAALLGCQPSTTPTTVAQPAATVQPTVPPVVPTDTVAQPTATSVPGACNVTPPTKQTTISFLGWSEKFMDAYTKNIENCDSVSNIKVNIRTLDNSAAIQQMQLAFSGGGTSPYDIVQMANSSMQTIGGNGKGWLMPLNDLIKKYKDQYDLGDIPQAAWDAATFNGQILGIPVDANTLHLMYRTDLFKKYNLQPPTTYDDVIADCKVLKAEKSLTIPFNTDLSAGWAWDLEFYQFLKSFGGVYLNPDNTPGWNSPEGVAALTKMKEVVDACMGPTGLSMGYTDNATGLETGTIGMIEIWADSAPAMDDPTQSHYVGSIGFAPAPAAKPGGLLAGSAWNDFLAIPASTGDDPNLLFQVIMSATTLQVQAQLASQGLIMPARQKALTAPGSFRSLQAALTTINQGVGARQNLPGESIAETMLGNYLPLVGTGQLTPQEALSKAEADYIKEATTQGILKK
jgi:ABC-type glycerol-3-phosphate transport system substrate-binding protein